MPTYRVTMQDLKPPSPNLRIPVPQRDVRVDWTGPLAPPSVLLDFVYGIAAIKRWAARPILPLLDYRHSREFAAVQGDPLVSASVVRPRRKNKSKEWGLSQAMDAFTNLSLLLKGYPPGTTWEIVDEERERAAEVRSRQVGATKVQSWLEDTQLTQSHTSPQLGDISGF